MQCRNPFALRKFSSVASCVLIKEGVVAANNHSYVVQPRSQHPDEVIVWEMDESTLPRGVIDETGESHESQQLHTTPLLYSISLSLS